MRFVSLQSKDVINVYDGKKIGYIVLVISIECVISLKGDVILVNIEQV